MKFVRQTNYGDTHVDPKRGEMFIAPHYVEEPLVDAWLGAVARHETPMTVEEAPDGAFFDPGGMVMQGEAEVWVEVNGQRLGCFL